VVLPPGASYELAVDLRCTAATAGNLAQWVLVAVVECPPNWTWKGEEGGQSASGSNADVGMDAGMDMDGAFDPADVHVIGRRVGALVASSQRGASELSPLLDAEAPTFVPRRLLEAFDSLPRVVVVPVCLVDDDDEDNQRSGGTSRRDARSAAAVEATTVPAAYRGPLGAHFPRWGDAPPLPLPPPPRCHLLYTCVPCMRARHVLYFTFV